jgi:pimeloyl-ACP methyl ester carboxylesterase
VLTNWLDPSVTDETDPLSADPALDPFNPDNGPPYSAEFQQAYRQAQRARNERITNWCYLGEPVRANYGVFGIGTLNTLRTWLSRWSLRTSQCTAAPHLRRITVPSLVVQATSDTGVFEDDARALFDAIGTADKRLEFIKADHYLLEPAGSRAQAADLIAAWVAGKS